MLCGAIVWERRRLAKTRLLYAALAQDGSVPIGRIHGACVDEAGRSPLGWMLAWHTVRHLGEGRTLGPHRAPAAKLVSAGSPPGVRCSPLNAPDRSTATQWQVHSLAGFQTVRLRCLRSLALGAFWLQPPEPDWNTERLVIPGCSMWMPSASVSLCFKMRSCGLHP